MSAVRPMIEDMAQGLFADLADLEFAAVWPRIADAGFASLLVSEGKGGIGGDWGDLLVVMRLAGRHSLAAPVGETVIAHRLLADAGIDLPEGAIALAVDGERAAWGRDAAAVLAIAGEELALYPAEACRFELGSSPAGEPRDLVAFTAPPLARAECPADVFALGAFLRTAQTAGALGAGLELAIEHVNARVQFGRPLAKFQAVQQALALASEECAAVDAAARGAAAALDVGEASLEIAAAKLRANLAIDRAAPILHQVHGAIGFTMEYPLQRHTRRLIGWRSEFGNDALWAARLGRQIAGLGGAGMWAEITARGYRHAP